MADGVKLSPALVAALESLEDSVITVVIRSAQPRRQVARMAAAAMPDFGVEDPTGDELYYWPRMSGPALTKQGVSLGCADLYDEPDLKLHAVGLVAERLARAGVRGELDLDYASAPMPWPTGKLLILHTGVEATGRREGRGRGVRWKPREAAAGQLLAAGLAWVLRGDPPQAHVQFGQVDGSWMPAAHIASVLGRAVELGTDVRVSAPGPDGVIAQLRWAPDQARLELALPVAEGADGQPGWWREPYAQLRSFLITQHALVTDATVDTHYRDWASISYRDTTPPRWPHRSDRVQFCDWHLTHQLGLKDVLGLMVVPTDWLARPGVDWTGWQVSDLSEGHALIEARDLQPWLSPQLPDLDVLTRARHQLAPLLATEEPVNAAHQALPPAC